MSVSSAARSLFLDCVRYVPHITGCQGVECLLLGYACAHGEELAYQDWLSRRGQEERGALCRVRLVCSCVHLPSVGAVWHAPGCLFRHAGCSCARGGGGICLVCFQLGTEGEVTHLGVGAMDYCHLGVLFWLV